MDKESFRNPNDLINAFKKAVMASTAVASKPESIPVPATAAKRSKFDTGYPKPPPPGPPPSQYQQPQQPHYPQSPYGNHRQQSHSVSRR